MEGAGTEAVGEAQSAAPEETLSLKRKSDDVGYGYLCDPTNLNKTKVQVM
jgi:hypothetical protein